MDEYLVQLCGRIFGWRRAECFKLPSSWVNIEVDEYLVQLCVDEYLDGGEKKFSNCRIAG